MEAGYASSLSYFTVKFIRIQTEQPAQSILMVFFIGRREDEMGGQVDRRLLFFFFFLIKTAKRLGKAVYTCVVVSDWLNESSTLFKNAINPDGFLALVAGEAGLSSCRRTCIFTSICILLVPDIRRYRITYYTISVTAFTCKAKYQIAFHNKIRGEQLCAHTAV